MDHEVSTFSTLVLKPQLQTQSLLCADGEPLALEQSVVRNTIVHLRPLAS